MRVVLAQLTNFPESGRVDIYEYAKALAALGVDTHAIVCKNVASDIGPGLTVHELNLSTNAGPTNSLRFAWRALKQIHLINQGKKVDVVHLFNPAPATFALGWLLKFSAKRPKIIYDIRTGGIGSGFDSRLIDFMARLSPLFADGVITLSASLKTRLFGQKAFPHAVVPLGVATDRFNVAPNRPKHGDFVFIYIGSASKNRRLAAVIEAFAIVLKKYPQARLRLVGGGDEWEALKTLAKTRKIARAVTFLPTVPFEQIPKLLQSADCGVSYIPITDWFNPQPPLKTLEYLSCGLPVVATATDSQKELWRNLPSKLLRDDSIEDFTSGLEFALCHRDELKTIDFRATALPFDWQAITRDQLIPFYRQIVKN